MRAILTVVVLLFSSSVCWADVFIAKANRVSNRGYGVCAWSSVEMAGRQGEVKEVEGLAEYRDKESKRIIKQIHYNWSPGSGWTYDFVSTEQRNNGGTIERMREQLDKLNVKYTSQLEDVRDRQILFDGTKSGSTGCVVGLRNYAYTGTTSKRKGCRVYKNPKPGRTLGYHAVLLIHIDDDDVKFMDPNDVTDPWIVSREWFDEHWDGSGMVIVPKVRSDTFIVHSPIETSTVPAAVKTYRVRVAHPRWVQVLIQSGMSEEDALLTWNRMQGKGQ